MSLSQEAERLRRTTLSALSSDAERGQELRLRVGAVYADFSRQLLDAAALDELLALAEAVDLDRWRRALAEGEALNNTEARPALHHAVRAGSDDVQEGPIRAS